jgi:MYXO-CTERM domain-containing protein
LPQHSSLQISFDLAVWDSVDGYPGGYPYGDHFVVQVDGVTVVNALFGNFTQTGLPIGPGDLVAGPGTYGYDSFWDSIRRLKLTLAHTAPTAQISFSFPSSQGGGDEAFGLDNLSVSVTPVPEPGVAALWAAGLAALAWRRRSAVARGRGAGG